MPVYVIVNADIAVEPIHITNHQLLIRYSPAMSVWITPQYLYHIHLHTNLCTKSNWLACIWPLTVSTHDTIITLGFNLIFNTGPVVQTMLNRSNQTSYTRKRNNNTATNKSKRVMQVLRELWVKTGADDGNVKMRENGLWIILKGFDLTHVFSLVIGTRWFCWFVAWLCLDLFYFGSMFHHWTFK